jgi:RHS repeat-associated protein
MTTPHDETEKLSIFTPWSATTPNPFADLGGHFLDNGSMGCDSDNPGQLISAQIGTGAGVVTETRAYDKRLRPTTLTDGVAYSFDITNYAPDSDILGATDSVNGTWGYGTGTNYTNGYDDMNRLLMAVPSGKTWSYTYAYDRYGNRWQQNLAGTGGSGPHFSTTFDANNHVSDGTVSYDAAGNVMQDVFNTYTYDSQNQMISSLSRSSGSLTCYFYDAYGRRVQKTTGATSCGYPIVGGTSLYYVYDAAGNLIDEVSAPSGGTGTWTRQEIYAAGRHLATFNASAGQAYWDFSDWLGTERARVNAVTGAVAETCTSLPWGDNLQCTGADQSPLHFTGKQRDMESNLDDFGARYYSSAVGRWLAPDWSATPDAVPYGKLDNPQSLILYDYVLNNPLSQRDDDGHEIIYADGLKNSQLVQDSVQAILADPHTSGYLSGYVGPNNPNLIIQSGDLSGGDTATKSANGQTVTTTTVQGATVPDIQTATSIQNGVTSSPETTLTGATITIDNRTSKGDTPGVLVHESVHAGEARANPGQFSKDAAAEKPLLHDARPQEQRANAAQKAYSKEIKQAVKQIEKDRKKEQDQSQ